MRASFYVVTNPQGDGNQTGLSRAVKWRSSGGS